MLNRSQILLAKNVTLEPFSFVCSTNHAGRAVPATFPLFVVVKTRAMNTGPLFERRMFTRASWAREAQALGIPVIYAVGRPIDEQTQAMLEYENQIYGDILQINYIGKNRRLNERTIVEVSFRFVLQHHDQNDGRHELVRSPELFARLSAPVARR